MRRVPLAFLYTSTGGVASEEPLASSIGASILDRGGNAVDAAIATSLALSVLVPHLGGIGGDYFALIAMPEGEVYFVNGSGHSPARLTKSLLAEKGLDRVPSTGPLSPVVPGIIDALHLLWKRFGSLEWSELVEPAERLAREGFPAPPSLVSAISSNASLLSRDRGSKETYLEQDIREPGQPVAFPGLASLLSMVKEDPRSFYSDEPAEAIEEYLSSIGGVLSKGDMRSYHAYSDEPVSIGYRGWKITEMPPNTQGITTLHILSLLEEEDLPRDPLERLPQLLSAAIPAYRARDEYIGDPRYMRVKARELLSKEFIEALRREKTTALETVGGSADTTFYVAIDREGIVVAGIQSLFNPFGSGVTEPKFQITLNSRAQSFTLRENHPNTLLPYKRPLHTLSAVIATPPEEDRVYALGLSGGHLRPQLHALLLTSIIDHGMGLVEAISAPRAVWLPGSCQVIVDKGFESKVSRIAPHCSIKAGRTGVAAGLTLNRATGVALLATDSRGDGLPVASTRA